MTLHFAFSIVMINFIFTSTGQQHIHKTCSDLFTCDFAENGYIPPCFCDRDCIYFADCCKEYLQNFNISSIPLTTDSLVTETCEDLVSGAVYLERVGAFMITSCGEEKCEYSRKSYASFIPVSTTTKTYKNANCAMCNNATNFEYWTVNFGLLKIEKSWLTNVTLSINDFLDESLTNKFIFHPPRTFSPRFCYPQFDRMNVKSETLFYQAPVYSLHCFYLFKNIDHCSQQECCRPNELHRCQILPLKDHPEKEENLKEMSKGLGMKRLQALILPSQGNHVEEIKEDLTLKLKHTKSWISIQMRILRETHCAYCNMDEKYLMKITGIERCFHALTVVLVRVKYKFLMYQLSFGMTTNSTGGVTFITGMVTQTEPLSPGELHLMKEWRISFRCSDSMTGFKSVGEIELVDDKILKYDEALRIRSDLRLQSLHYEENCRSVSLKIDDRNFIAVECIDTVGDVMNVNNAGSFLAIFTINWLCISAVIEILHVQ